MYRSFLSIKSGSWSYISLAILGLDVALFDTGTISSIHGQGGIHLIHYFNLEVYLPNFDNVVVANCSEQTVKGGVYVPICISDDCQLVRMSIVSGIPTH